MVSLEFQVPDIEGRWREGRNGVGRFLLSWSRFACLGLMVSMAAAETQEALTWDACLDYAWEWNPSLARARESLNQARYDYESARSVFRPTLDGSADVSHSDRNGDTADDAGTQSSLGLNARYTLFAGGADRARVDQAEAGLRIALADWRSSAADAGSALKRSFANLLYAQEDVQLGDRIAERQKQNVDLVSLRYESGKEHKGSYLRTRATYRSALSDANRARRGLRVAQRELATALGRSEFDVLIAQGRLAAVAPTNDPEWRALLRAVPDHLRAEAQVTSAEAAVRIARSPYYPDLGIQASASTGGEDFDPESENWSVGLSASFPFYAGGKHANDLASARAAGRGALAGLQATDEQSLARLESAWADFQDAVERRDVRRDFLEAATVRAEIARNQYASGLLSFEDWDRIEDDLISAQKDMLAGERDAVLAESAWENAQGVNLFRQP
jgi:outer membrane protein TolC